MPNFMFLIIIVIIIFEACSSKSNQLAMFRFRNKEFFFPARGSSIDEDYCRKEAECHKNFNSSRLYCFDSELPYLSISFDLIPDTDLIDIERRFQLFRNLQNFPKCWNVIQPYLCAIYMPSCTNGSVNLPSLEMCRTARIPCQFVYDSTNLLPAEIFSCESFQKKCKNDLLNVQFNTTGVCQSPLVSTDQPDNFYKNVEGCGLQCKSPLYTNEEHTEIHRLIAWGSIICFICSAFTVITFLIDWKNANKYPALVIFYINFCAMISFLGWLLQFYGPDSRNDIVCRKDGTLRSSEPSARENLSCVFVFVLVYYFSMASIVWFVVLTYAWYMNFLALGKMHEKVDKQKAYFHLMAWSIPLVLTIATMAFGLIDGDYITGICFVGHFSNYARVFYLLIPFAISLLIGGYFLFKGLVILIRLQFTSRDIISSKARSKIRSTIFRVGIFTTLTYSYATVTFIFNIYILLNGNLWNESLNNYIMCKLTHNENERYETCYLRDRPSFAMLQLQLIAYFATSVTSSSWVWTKATVDSWLRYIKRKFGYENETVPTKLQKHKVIAKAFAKRKVFYQNGRLSISLQHSHTDPVGMNFDLNSVPSNDDLSCTWAAALPKLVYRRDALTGAYTNSCSSTARNSVDSEISISRTRVSYESRRNSLDSQLSVQIVKETHKFNKKNHKRRKREVTARKNYRANQMDDSVAKQLISLLGDAEEYVNNRSGKKVNKPNMKRRSAISGINDGLIAGKNILPLQNLGNGHEHEDDNHDSRTSEYYNSKNETDDKDLTNKDLKTESY